MFKKRAFTLIELLVVIAIIALLLAIILPSLQKIKESARIMMCKSNVRQMTLSFIIYADDFDGKLPHKPQGSLPYPHIWWEAASNASRPDNRIFFDGYLDGFILQEANVWTEGVDEAPKVMYCPSVKGTNSKLFGYGRQWPNTEGTGWRPFISSYSYFNLGETLGAGTWFSAADMPKTTSDRGALPVFGDIIEIYGSNLDIRAGGQTMRLANHFKEGFDELVSTDERLPIGMNMGHLDGSASWYDYEQCEVYWDQGALNIWGKPN